MADHETQPGTDLLSPQQAEAVVLLAAGNRKSDTARMVGVHRSTVHGWLHLPAFAAAVEAERERRLAELRGDPLPYLSGLRAWEDNAGRVMDTILEVALDKRHPNHFRAAELILRHLAPEAPSAGPTADEKLIQGFAESRGWEAPDGA